MRLVLAACLLCALNSGAQDTTSSPSIRRWAITFRPLGAVNPFLTNHTFGLQYNITKNFVIEANAGWIQSWFYVSTQNADNIFSSGYKLGGELKYVIWKGMYFSLQGFYNDYKRTSEEYVWRFGETYEEKMEVDRFISVWGGHLNGGIMLTNPDKKFFFDFYAGLGARQKTVLVPGLPDDAQIINNGGPNQAPGVYGSPSISMGVALGYYF